MVKKPRTIWSPDHLTDALIREQNKLIHLDPVPLFKEKSDIKPWLQKIFFPQGIDLVIERSDSGKVIFKCKSNIKHEYKKRKSDSTSNNNEPKFSCPFRIRATFSLKLQKWNIVVVNNVHSHDLQFNPTSDEYKKFKKLLILNNDFDTIKNFEELEYKTKLKLPILPQVMTCDCGLTNEINWFDVVLPEPRISTCKPAGNRVDKKKNNKKNIKQSVSQQIEIPAISSSSLNTFLQDTTFNSNIKLPSPPVQLVQTPPNMSMVNLDEIDFTDMFKTPRGKNDDNNNQTTSLFDNKNENLQMVKKENNYGNHSSSSSLSSTTLMMEQSSALPGSDPLDNVMENELMFFNPLAPALKLDEQAINKNTIGNGNNIKQEIKDEWNGLDTMTMTGSTLEFTDSLVQEPIWPNWNLENNNNLDTIDETNQDQTNNGPSMNSYLDFLDIANCPI